MFPVDKYIFADLCGQQKFQASTFVFAFRSIEEKSLFRLIRQINIMSNIVCDHCSAAGGEKYLCAAKRQISCCH